MSGADSLEALFDPSVRSWFDRTFEAPTAGQARAWPAIARGDHTLLLAPTGSGKTLAAFLWAINRLMIEPQPDPKERCRVLYVSPLKALAVDVERNLRSPLVGIHDQAVASGRSPTVPTMAVRTGDTPPADRARFVRRPADILITTPESLYLMLTSRAREALASIQTIIIDEIHALVPTKRGSHLALSLERLEVGCAASPQRIGLSATQRPLDEVARFLGGYRCEPGTEPRPRPVTIIDASAPKPLSLSVEVPVEDMAAIGRAAPDEGNVDSVYDEDLDPQLAETRPRFSIWEAVHPRLWALISKHRSTILFCNSRRLAERLAAAINEEAGEPVCRAHHGSLARQQRLQIEDALKAGQLKALVATSSLELGIDMGAVDLVLQIEAPPSVASGLQRVGRASHHVGAVSTGVVFPKYRGDLVACAALTQAMMAGQVEATRYPRNPVDVLAQQIVAMVAMDKWGVDDLYACVRAAAPFVELGQEGFENVLDMLGGRYASEAFAELRPRVTWDRHAGTLEGRRGAQRLAVANPGTIPDRGLYGVFLADGQGQHARHSARVGELDEEMVFETIRGETFMLGASTWRVQDITLDRVLVTPAPGEPGKMPFWRGERPWRPLEFGRAIGALVRELGEMPRPAAHARLVDRHALAPGAAENLLLYLDDQREAGAKAPSDERIIVERTRDELGDWRICVLSPLGGKVHAPWSMAVLTTLREELDVEPEIIYGDDGFVIRLPEMAHPPGPELLMPDPDQVEAQVIEQLSGSGLFAARFREAAGRALLLPRRQAGKRAPLWRQRQRAADLLAVASRHPSFPIILETYRECLADVFDMGALREVLRAVRSRAIEVEVVDLERPSPFASALLFNYAANYIYDGDAPLAERRAQALSIDHAQLRELLGDLELRELLDHDAMLELEAELQQRTRERRASEPDGLHDLLLRLGDLTEDELRQRSGAEDDATHAQWVARLVSARRIIRLKIAGEPRFVAAEAATRYRDGLGVSLPLGLPERLLEGVPDAKRELYRRFAKTHGPFDADALGSRYGLDATLVVPELRQLEADGELVEGAFRPGGVGIEWCHPDVLSRLRRRSLAKLRQEVEAVEPDVLGRALLAWQGLRTPSRGPDALLDVIEQLQGAAIPASVLEREVLAARVRDYRPGDLDLLAAAGEVVWHGVSALGKDDGRVALYLADHAERLGPQHSSDLELEATEARVVESLDRLGASFFSAIHAECGGGFEDELVEALWRLVWKGAVGNDTFAPLRAYVYGGRSGGRRGGGRSRGQRGARGRMAFRSRRASPPRAEGRWVNLRAASGKVESSTTEHVTHLAQQLIARYGIVTREVAQAEGIEGGFSKLYEVFRALEDAGKIRRGYFVTGVSTLQFASPAMLDLLRASRAGDGPTGSRVACLSAVDPANPYGALLPWPRATESTEESTDRAATPRRSVGSHVVLVDGRLCAYATRGLRRLRTYLSLDEMDGDAQAKAVADALAAVAVSQRDQRGIVSEIDGRAPAAAENARVRQALEAAGFVPTYDGLRTPQTVSDDTLEEVEGIARRG